MSKSTAIYLRGWEFDKDSSFWFKESALMAVENKLIFDHHEDFINGDCYVKLIYGWKVYTLKKGNIDILKTYIQKYTIKKCPSFALFYPFVDVPPILDPKPRKRPSQKPSNKRLPPK